MGNLEKVLKIKIVKCSDLKGIYYDGSLVTNGVSITDDDWLKVLNRVINSNSAYELENVEIVEENIKKIVIKKGHLPISISKIYNMIIPPKEDTHRYNGICQLLSSEELANPNNNICNNCMYSIGTERQWCRHNEEFDKLAIKRNNFSKEIDFKEIEKELEIQK